MRFTNPFGPLPVSADDAARLGDIARVFVEDGVQRYERHVHQARRQVDERQWRLVKQRESVRVYAEHSPAARPAGPAGPAGSTSAAAPAERDPADVKQRVEAAPEPPPELPALLVVGTVEGTLADAMYGAVNPTLDAMRVKTSYVDDQVADAAVLASLVEPSARDPFRSLALKWMEQARPALLQRALAKKRDFVYLEATGMAALGSGERVGYHLLHSISFAQAPELDGCVRASMSVCGVYRQRAYNTVEVFVRAVLSPGGHMPRALVVRAAADALVSASRLVDCGRRKKVAWLLKTRRGASTRAVEKLLASSRGGELAAPVLSEAEPETCISCHTPARRVSFGSAPAVASHKRRCRLCLHYVCNACRVTQRLSFVAVDGRLLQPELRFCAACVGDSMEADALAVAREELALGDRFTDPRMYISPESSGVSELGATWLEA